MGRLQFMRLVSGFLVLGLLLIGLAGCSYYSDKPLISDQQAAFPFGAMLTFTDDHASDSGTLTRKGPDYFLIDPEKAADPSGSFRFMRCTNLRI
jgi:hypothetical protein